MRGEGDIPDRHPRGNFVKLSLYCFDFSVLPEYNLGMKIKTQTESYLSVDDGNISTIILGSVFFLIGVWAGYTLLNSSNNQVGSWVVTIVFVTVGLAIVLFSYSIIVDFDKTNGQVTYQEKGLIRNKKANYNIFDIVRIETRKGWKTTTSTNKNGLSTSNQVPVSQSFIVFKDGSDLALNRQVSQSSGVLISGISINTDGGFANSIATFLSVPFQVINPNITENVINTNLGGGIQL